jgi:hypothetical protein
MKHVVDFIVTLFDRRRLISLLADMIDQARLRLPPWRFIEKVINRQRNLPALRGKRLATTVSHSTYGLTKRFLRRKNTVFPTPRRVISHPVLYIVLSIKRKRNSWGRRRH